MSQPQPQFLTVGARKKKRAIAYIRQEPETNGHAMGQKIDPKTGLIWLLGLKSDMASTKATALSNWAPSNGFGLTRFDYSGHGQSEGVFDDATVGDWLEEARDVLLKLTSGPQILVGSSTGGHIALLLLRDLLTNDPQVAKRIKALVLVAPAWDLTQDLMWDQFTEDEKREVMEKGVVERPSGYEEPYRITRNFIEEGRNHLFKREPWNPGRPVVVLQGGQDTSVPPQHARDLMAFLEGSWGQLIEVPDGDHSLSRPQDLRRLFKAIKHQRA